MNGPVPEKEEDETEIIDEDSEEETVIDDSDDDETVIDDDDDEEKADTSPLGVALRDGK